MPGQGAKLRSSWASRWRGTAQPRKVVQHADTDPAETSVWQDWWFEAAAVGGDPEIALIRGGKLVDGGLLRKGGLTG